MVQWILIETRAWKFISFILLGYIYTYIYSHARIHRQLGGIYEEFNQIINIIVNVQIIPTENSI